MTFRNVSGVIGMLLLIVLSACMHQGRGEKNTMNERPLPSSISSTSMSSSCGQFGCGLPLSDEQKHVLYEAGTEQPFTSPLYHEKRKGTYVAADTGEPLFRSEAKFESGTGWPSFFEPMNDDVVVLKTDRKFGMTRTEVLTKNGSHLGHVFDDGPEPTGKRYCINGAALRFVPDEE